VTIGDDARAGEIDHAVAVKPIINATRLDARHAFGEEFIAPVPFALFVNKTLRSVMGQCQLQRRDD
jgi:hypothetical protein